MCKWKIFQRFIGRPRKKIEFFIAQKREIKKLYLSKIFHMATLIKIEQKKFRKFSLGNTGFNKWHENSIQKYEYVVWKQ